MVESQRERVTERLISAMYLMVYCIHARNCVSIDVYLIIGLCGDYEVEEYKRKPFFSEDDRYQILSSIKEVDQVIFPGPLVITPEFMERHKIDLVVHGFSDMKDFAKQSEFFEQIKDKFETIPYYPPVSTSGLIKNICERCGDKK